MCKGICRILSERDLGEELGGGCNIGSSSSRQIKVKKTFNINTLHKHTLLSIRVYKFLFFAEQQQNKHSQKSQERIDDDNDK